MNYKINIQTVTELSQSKGKTTLGFTPTLQIMTKSKIVNNSRIGYFPYYTGNSIRGLLHRELANYVMDALKEKSTLTISPRNYHLIAAGGGSNFQDQIFSVVDKVRELKPIASAFGISLAEGKLMVSNFNPLDCFKKK